MESNKYKLVIVESPNKAQSIQKYLGKDFKVIASAGHIIDMPTNEFGVSLDTFEQTLVVIDRQVDTVKKIKDAAKNASEVFLASDPDREGEAIAYHIKSVLPKSMKSSRVKFNAITKDVILKAIANPETLNENLYNSQQARRILDRIVGYKISPLLWNKLSAGLSAGRVQSVALRIIVEREDEILNFKPDKSFAIIATLSSNNINFESKYFGKDIVKKNTLKDETEANKIFEDIKCKNFILTDKVMKTQEKAPSPPFTTSKMQQEASLKLKFGVKQTMNIAQKLYEGKSMGELGTAGLITYMRTDSVRTEEKALNDLREYIANNYSKESLSSSVIIHKLKKKEVNAQDAHEAIRPASMEFTPAKVKPYLSAEEFALYELIWKKFVASQMANCVIDRTTYSFSVEGHIFKSVGSVIKEKGFTVVFDDSENDGEKESEADNSQLTLPIIEKDVAVPQIKEAIKKENWTSPPPRFNEAGLVKELEEKGIGRPATYAAIISNIQDREYVVKEEDRFKPTKLGKATCYLLIKEFPTQFDLNFTASVEKQLDEIAEGNLEFKVALASFWKDLDQILSNLKNNLGQLKPSKISLKIQCSNCSNGKCDLEVVNNSFFMKCNACEFRKKIIYKNGEFMEANENEKKATVDLSNLKDCVKCGKGKMVEKSGKFGVFFACNNYPDCKHTMQVSKETGVVCHKCHVGVFVEKTAKSTGNKFWGCNQYPNCSTAVWNEPVKQKCVHCLKDGMQKNAKNGKLFCLHCEKENDPV